MKLCLQIDIVKEKSLQWACEAASKLQPLTGQYEPAFLRLLINNLFYCFSERFTGIDTSYWPFFCSILENPNTLMHLQKRWSFACVTGALHLPPDGNKGYTLAGQSECHVPRHSSSSQTGFNVFVNSK